MSKKTKIILGVIASCIVVGSAYIGSGKLKKGATAVDYVTMLQEIIVIHLPGLGGGVGDAMKNDFNKPVDDLKICNLQNPNDVRITSTKKTPDQEAAIRKSALLATYGIEVFDCKLDLTNVSIQAYAKDVYLANVYAYFRQTNPFNVTVGESSAVCSTGDNRTIQLFPQFASDHLAPGISYKLDIRADVTGYYGAGTTQFALAGIGDQSTDGYILTPQKVFPDTGNNNQEFEGTVSDQCY